MSSVAVDPEWLVERVARRVVELLNEREQPPAAPLVDAATLARLLGISRSSVYERAEALGAREVGSGSRPRLRFDVDEARTAWARRVPSKRSNEPELAPAAAMPRPPRRRRRAAARSGDGLLPIHPVEGRDAA